MDILPVVRPLKLSDLKIDPKYQRQINRKWVKNTAKDFDPNAVNVLQVSERKDGMYIMNGQHRRELLTEVGHEYWDCSISSNLTDKQEANLFNKINKNVNAVTPMDSFHALLCEKKGIALKMFKLAKECGIIIKHQPGLRGGYFCKAIVALRTCYKSLGEDGYKRCLGLIIGIWNGSEKSLSTRMIMGLTRFLKAYGDDLDDGQFVTAMKKYCPDPKFTITKVDNNTKLYGGNLYLNMAKEIVMLYNTKRKHNSLYRLDINKLPFNDNIDSSYTEDDLKVVNE